jgi:hypothetical protein
MQVGRRGTRAAALVGVASLSLLVSACGGSNSAVPPTTRAKPTTTTSAPATTTTDPTTTAVLGRNASGLMAIIILSRISVRERRPKIHERCREVA